MSFLEEEKNSLQTQSARNQRTETRIFGSSDQHHRRNSNCSWVQFPMLAADGDEY
jgi:hypothetical protein